MSKYEIPRVDLNHGEVIGEFGVLADDEHAVWDHLHAAYEAACKYNAAPEWRKDFALGDFNRAFDEALDDVSSVLLGCGFVSNGDCYIA